MGHQAVTASCAIVARFLFGGGAQSVAPPLALIDVANFRPEIDTFGRLVDAGDTSRHVPRMPTSSERGPKLSKNAHVAVNPSKPFPNRLGRASGRMWGSPGRVNSGPMLKLDTFNNAAPRIRLEHRRSRVL